MRAKTRAGAVLVLVGMVCGGASAPLGCGGSDAAKVSLPDAGGDAPEGGAAPRDGGTPADARGDALEEGGTALDAGAPVDAGGGTEAQGTSPACASITSTSGALVDESGNVWNLVSGDGGGLVVDENGAAAGYSNGVIRLVYANGAVSQENSQGDWWYWANGTWDTESDPTVACQDGGMQEVDAGDASSTGSIAPLVVPASGGSGAHLVTVGSSDRLELHGVVVWGIQDFITTSFAAAQYANRDAIAATVAQWGGNVIRLRVLADEYVHLTLMASDANYLQWVKDWVAAAEAHGLYVQICWWDSLDSQNGKNDANWATQYAYAFPMMNDVHHALALADGSDDPAVFYEPFNEPNNVGWTDWLTAMKATVSQFRSTMHYQGLLVLDTTTWSHDYSDQYMAEVEALDATLTTSRRSNLAFARHDYTNDYGNNWNGGTWIGNTGGSATAHVMYETEFGNYNGPGIQSDAWSAAVTGYFKTDLFDRSNVAGADAFLFGNWSDANALSSDPSGNAPTTWGNDVRNWLSAYP